MCEAGLFIKTFSRIKNHNFICCNLCLCFILSSLRPVRDNSSKYFVSSEEYSPPVYPNFTFGMVYLITRAAVHDLYMKSMELAYFKLEDVFVTGIVAELVKVKRINVNEFANFASRDFSACEIRKTISTTYVNSAKQFDFWKKLLDTNEKC